MISSGIWGRVAVTRTLLEGIRGAGGRSRDSIGGLQCCVEAGVGREREEGVRGFGGEWEVEK